jgi:hypothetical protein
MGRPLVRFVDDGATQPKSAMKARRPRKLLTVTLIIGLLLIVDATALGGRCRRTAWLELQANAHILGNNLIRMMAFGGTGR